MARVSSSLMHNVSLVSNFNIQYIFSSLSRSLVHINFLYWLLLVCRVLFCATHSLTNNQKESWDSLFTCSVFYSVEWFTLFYQSAHKEHDGHDGKARSSCVFPCILGTFIFSPCYTWWMGKVLQNGFKSITGLFSGKWLTASATIITHVVSLQGFVWWNVACFLWAARCTHKRLT